MGQQDSAFMRNFMIILAGMVIFAFVIFGIAQVVATTDVKPVASAKSEENIKRVSVVATEKTKVAAKATTKKVSVAAKVVRGGKAGTINPTCNGCHASGVAGAPKVGDKAAWAARAKKGMAAMVQIVVKGKGAMPPNGATKLNAKQIEEQIKLMMK